MSARLSLLGLVAALAFVAAVRGDDYFEQKKQEQALKAQKAVSDVMAALKTAQQLEKTNPAQAKEVLQNALVELADSRALSDKDYKDLQNRLLSRLKQLDGAAASQKAGDDYKSKVKADKEAAAEKEREFKATQVAQNKNPYDQAKDRIDGAKKVLDSTRDLTDIRNKNFTDMGVDFDKTMAKGAKEERITAAFIARSERLKQKLTKEETALLKALNSKMTPDFDKSNTTLKNFLEYIQDKVPGLTIFVDEGSMKEANIEYDTPVGFKVKNQVTVRTILKKVLADVGMTYIIKDGAVQVITPEKTKDYLVTRAYPVQDLIAPFDMRMPQYATQAQMFQNAQALIQMIVNMVEPTSWVGMSERGYGSIWYDPASMAIMVRHTAEMHYQLGGGLSR
jgi:hypothetical protein